MSDIKVLHNLHTLPSEGLTSVDMFSGNSVAPAHRFLNTIPQNPPTPLIKLTNAGQELGVAEIWVKDESQRLGLNAFKAVGAVYAGAQILAQKLGLSDSVSFAGLKQAVTAAPQVTFTTATDGNHGKAVAWAARELGQRAVIYLPHGASAHRLIAIEELGAQVHLTNLNYDDAVRLAATNATQHGWELVQDTAWSGYMEIPTWIMQGYTVIAREVLDALPKPPTHVILQAGVGSFAGATLGYFVGALGESCPITVIAEPHNAACIFKSAQAGDGQPHNVTGDLATIMAGLSCGEPNPIAWEIIRDYAHAFCSCSDAVAELGMQMLAHPIGTDPRIIAGESGAVGLGLLAYVMRDNSHEDIRRALKLDHNSRVLVINTEGDTDPESYRRITRIGPTR